MKTKIILTAGLILGSTLFGFGKNGTNNDATNVSITVFTTEQTQTLVSVWAESYSKQEGSSLEVFDFENGFRGQAHLEDDQLIIAKESELAQIQVENGWNLVIGREIVVPVISKQNPHFAALMDQGVSAEMLKNALENPATFNWGALMGNAPNQKITLYRINNDGTQNNLANFVNHDVVAGMMAVNTLEELLAKLSKEPAALGFCRLADLVIAGATSFPDGFALLPFDFNKNGKLEQIENIYATPDAFSRGVWIGKYPGELYQNIYAVTADHNYTPAQKNFLNWLISAGQSHVTVVGLTPLANSEIASKYSKINHVAPQPEISNDHQSIWPYLLALFSLVVIAMIYFEFTLRRSKTRKMRQAHDLLESAGVFQLESLAVPRGVLYDKTHTWAFMEKDGIVRIGIDDFIQKITGPVSRVQLKDEGSRILKGEPFCTLIVDGKKITLNSPVTGIIRSFNPRLVDQATLLNQSPYNEGWVYLIEPSNWAREMEFMRMAEKYTEWLKVEFTRFKDFITRVAGKNHFGEASVVMQDGGELPTNVLHRMGPEVWEDFQTQFLDQAN
ncbi:MAG: hypothetical protein JXR22_09070 [Prolixibacteraceae bacterium]|nr:hypothetical protein [Prolixibacteraceae bacterium]